MVYTIGKPVNLCLHLGQYGQHPDRGIWRDCSLKASIGEGKAYLPKPEKLPGTEIDCPLVIVGNGEFDFTGHMQRPLCP